MLQYTETNKKQEDMKNILLLIMLALSICTTLGSAKHEETYNARITYYRDGSGKVSDRNTKRAIKGITIAAHPKFPFGTKVVIPQLNGKLDSNDEFIVQDRGSAVTKKKASRGKAFVFDIYVKTDKEVRYYAKHFPAYMVVKVLYK
jgi:hypothetical protein